MDSNLQLDMVDMANCPCRPPHTDPIGEKPTGECEWTMAQHARNDTRQQRPIACWIR